MIRTKCFDNSIKRSHPKGTELGVTACGLWCLGGYTLGLIETPLDDEGFVEIGIPDVFLEIK